MPSTRWSSASDDDNFIEMFVRSGDEDKRYTCVCTLHIEDFVKRRSIGIVYKHNFQQITSCTAAPALC